MSMKALLIVDAQNDFFPGGRLPVKNGEKIIPKLNDLQKRFSHIFVTKEWRPKEHKCFASNHEFCIIYDTLDIDGKLQTMWPEHCVQLTRGAEFHKDLLNHRNSIIITKGTDSYIDSYSAFFDEDRKNDTGLKKHLKSKNIRDLYICGLGTDRCVKNSAIDSVELGFNTYVVIDATAPFDTNPDILDKVITEFVDYGIKILKADEV